MVVGLVVTAAIAGAGLGWLITRDRRVAGSMAIAALALALGPGHNIPLLGGTPAVAKEIVILGAVATVAAVVLVAVHAWLIHHGIERRCIHHERAVIVVTSRPSKKAEAFESQDREDRAREEQPAIEEDTHDDAREEGQGELDPAHRTPAGLTARTYPAGESGSRRGSDQRAVMPPRVGQRAADSYSADWAMPSGQGARSGSEPEDPDVQREKVRCVIPLGATSDVTL